MGNTIQTVLRSFADGVPIFQEDVSVDVDVLEIYKVTVPHGGSVTVAILPCATHLFAIMAEAYQEPLGPMYGAVDVLTYKVHNSGGSVITLDCMQVFNGVAMCAKLGNLDAVLVYNTGVTDHEVTIVTGRNKEAL
jgi:hypothetical protein